MIARDIRQSFLDYFHTRGHRVVPSSSLVPAEDPTLLFTNAGMNQFKDVFLGQERREYRRATTAQKCMRVSGKHNDLDNVGPSLRHHTFFEMLGNFSFGDYFKQDAIPFAWELLTKVWSLEPDRLYPTIFEGDAQTPRDDEAFALWAAIVPAARITALGRDENFWQMGETGPCGRCSEIHYFRGAEVPCSEPVCRGVECSCERYVEVWNNVFMEFNRDVSGTLTPLPAPSIDTGMGLERITAVIQRKGSNYDTDLFTPILEGIASLIPNATYSSLVPNVLSTDADVHCRVIADHIRAMTFLIADGVVPSNEWRGYVLRKIMRRAMQHGKRLYAPGPFLHKLANTVVDEMGSQYPELLTGRETIQRVILGEEERFDEVLERGLLPLEGVVAKARGTTLDGGEVFKLYDSFGLPLDFIEDYAAQHGKSIDRTGFEAAMRAQRDRARAASTFVSPDAGHATASGSAPNVRVDVAYEGPEADVFTGYEHTAERDARVLQVVPQPGDTTLVRLSSTPFYAESGGQVSDIGTLTGESGFLAEVLGVRRPQSEKPRLHIVKVISGEIREGDRVSATVQADTRDATRRNHTATHLLHAALRQRLGAHVRQAGSLVAPDRLRFDFTHFQAMTADERREVERVVNEQIYRNAPVETEERSTEEAIKAGAMALFGEKYGDRVRVVSIPAFSLELCGGTHVRATGEIGPFVITEESGVAAGVRRIEALTGAGAVEYLQARGTALDRTLAALGAAEDQAPAVIGKLQAEAKRLARENEQLKLKLALGGGATATGEDADVVQVGDAKLIARRVAGLEKAALRGLSDSLRDRLKRGVVVLAAETDGKVQLLVSVTKDLTERVKAGQLIKELAPIVGGGGGGRPDFAEAGGKDASQIDALLAKAKELVGQALA
jgi:alanyl-tRNA synthetase